MHDHTLTTPTPTPSLASRFRSPADGRLRAGWRILGFLGIFYALALPATFGLRALFEFSKTSPVVIVIIAMTATPAVYLARRWFDKKSFVSLGLRWDRLAFADVVFGFLLSGLMAGTVFLLMSAWCTQLMNIILKHSYRPGVPSKWRLPPNFVLS